MGHTLLRGPEHGHTERAHVIRDTISSPTPKIAQRPYSRPHLVRRRHVFGSHSIYLIWPRTSLTYPMWKSQIVFVPMKACQWHDSQHPGISPICAIWVCGGMERISRQRTPTFEPRETIDLVRAKGSRDRKR